MRISKWGNSLAVRIPKNVVKELGLVEGDEVDLARQDAHTLLISKAERVGALQRIRELARPLPEGWKFDRDEANAR